MNDQTRPTKRCKVCDKPKDINCFSPGEWNRKKPSCMMCVRLNTMKRRGTLDRTDSQKRWCAGDFVISANSIHVNGTARPEER